MVRWEEGPVDYDDFSDNKKKTGNYHRNIIKIMTDRLDEMREEVKVLEKDPKRNARIIDVIKRQITRQYYTIGNKTLELKQYIAEGYAE